jgi:uncharacterized protein involved in oxidation of intracellular sulfur
VAKIKQESEKMETLTIIINSAPYGDEKVWNALRLAKTLVSASINMKVNIFLLGDAVAAAKKGQKPPEGYYNLEKMLGELVEKDVQVMACGTCINARGLAEKDLVEGIKVGTMMSLSHWVEESQKILSF